MPYRIEYSRQSIEHLEGLTAGERGLVMDAVDEQIVYQPTVETRNRKPMKPNILGAAIELRVHDHLRVNYGVDDVQAVVTVRGVGVKDRDRLRLGKEWVQS